MSIASASRRRRETIISLKRTKNELLRLQRGPLTRGHISKRKLIIRRMNESQMVLKKEEEPKKILMYVR